MITRSFGNAYSNLTPAKPTPLLKQLLTVLRRQRRPLLAVFFGVLLALTVTALVIPRSYTSEARLFLRVGKESVALDPTATMNEVINVTESRESEINSELEILRSRVLLEDVVDALGVDKVLPPDHDGNWLASLVRRAKSAVAWRQPEISRAEQAVNALAKSIVVTSPRKSSVMLVSCKASDPAKAQYLVQAFVDAYIFRHAKANSVSGSYDFFCAQTEMLRSQLVTTEEQLRDLKNQHNMTSIDGQREKVEAQANMIEVAMLENERQLATTEERLVSLNRILNDLPAQELAEEATVPDAAVESMRGELYKLQIEENEIRSRYSDRHPLAIARRQQVAEMRKILAAEQVSRTQPIRKVNLVHQSIRSELASAKAAVAMHRASKALLQRQFDNLNTKVQSLNDTEPRIKELTRQAELIEASYRTHIINREQTRVDEALESEQLSNVKLVQPASFAATPSSPSTKLMLALALVLASSSSLLAAFVAEHLDQSLKTAEQAEEELGVPVLFSVPRPVHFDLVRN